MRKLFYSSSKQYVNIDHECLAWLVVSILFGMISIVLDFTNIVWWVIILALLIILNRYGIKWRSFWLCGAMILCCLFGCWQFEQSWNHWAKKIAALEHLQHIKALMLTLPRIHHHK